jgi:hypothetical protein
MATLVAYQLVPGRKSRGVHVHGYSSSDASVDACLILFCGSVWLLLQHCRLGFPFVVAPVDLRVQLTRRLPSHSFVAPVLGDTEFLSKPLWK